MLRKGDRLATSVVSLEANHDRDVGGLEGGSCLYDKLRSCVARLEDSSYLMMASKLARCKGALRKEQHRDRNTVKDTLRPENRSNCFLQVISFV